MCDIHRTEMINRRINRAKIPADFQKKSFEDFDISCYPNNDQRSEAARCLKICQGFVNHFDEVKERGKGLYLYSKTKGSGKTFLASLIGNSLIRQGVEVRFTTAIGMLDLIKASWDAKNHDEIGYHSEYQVLEDFKTVPLLIIDEIGIEGNREWVFREMYKIINGRCENNLPTIFTSNVMFNQLNFDERISQRIGTMACMIHLPEHSARITNTNNQQRDFLAMLLG